MAGAQEVAAFQKLREASTKSDDDILGVLESMSTLNVEMLDDVECMTDLRDLLMSKNVEIQTATSKLIAEITKNSGQRQKFTDPKIMRLLLEMISPNKVENQTIQAMRALGNIFYENQKARELIDVEQDLHLYSLLDWKSENGLSHELEKQFVKNRCGLLSNYLVGSEIIAKRAVDLKVIPKIQQILKQQCTDVDKCQFLMLHVLPILSILSEMIDFTLDPPTTKEILRILRHCSSQEVGEICLELLQCQAESDDFKYLLAAEGLCDILHELLEKHKKDAKTDDAQTLMKLACDLIIQVLNGDDAMHYLYATPFLACIEKWLDSYDLDLLITSVLAIGNFARTDTHCIEFVNRGIMKKLIDILTKNNGADDDMRLQHALLSALRNLVIPKPNKAPSITEGLVKTILPMLENHQSPVVFKMLGTLRMAVDGQSDLAMELLQNVKLIEQLVTWSKTVEYHAGVSAEALRLMAWLIKFAYKNKNEAHHIDDSSIRKFIQVDDAVKSIVGMLSSTHLVMLNEALVALCIITVTLQNKSQSTVNLDTLFIENSIGQKIAEFISKNTDTMTKEIIENLQTLISQLKQSDALANHLNQFDINSLMKNIPSLIEYCTL